MKKNRAGQKEKGQEKTHALSHVMMRNIRTLVDLRHQEARERSLQDRIADAVTTFSGNMLFVYCHIAWFSIWITLNSGLFGLKPFDPFPYGLLTMIVSLEAIFLSTFVLISQNRQNEEAERRSDLDLHMDLLTEHELTRALMMLDRIEAKLGIEDDSDPELVELEREIKPEDVLAEIERLQKVTHERKKNVLES